MACSQWLKQERFDVSFATKCLSHMLATPAMDDFKRAKRFVRYFKGTADTFQYLMIPDQLAEKLNDYSDADWVGDRWTRKSTSSCCGWVACFWLFSECSSQRSVALSSGESEFYALGALAADLVHCKAVMAEIGMQFALRARCDSSVARMLG